MCHQKTNWKLTTIRLPKREAKRLAFRCRDFLGNKKGKRFGRSSVCPECSERPVCCAFCSRYHKCSSEYFCPSLTMEVV